MRANASIEHLFCQNISRGRNLKWRRGERWSKLGQVLIDPPWGFQTTLTWEFNRVLTNMFVRENLNILGKTVDGFSSQLHTFTWKSAIIHKVGRYKQELAKFMALLSKLNPYMILGGVKGVSLICPLYINWEQIEYNLHVYQIWEFGGGFVNKTIFCTNNII